MTDKEFISIVNNSTTMAAAAVALGIHFNTFKRKAVLLNCYKTNQGGKGCTKKWVANRSIPLDEILNGMHPYYQTNKLKHRLFNENIKTNKCEKCNIDKWNDEFISCELDHIDGNSKNHKLENLRILCPNCHSQTDTFRFKRGIGGIGRRSGLKTRR